MTHVFCPPPSLCLLFFFFLSFFFFDKLLYSDLPYDIITVGVASRMKPECKHPPRLRVPSASSDSAPLRSSLPPLVPAETVRSFARDVYFPRVERKRLSLFLTLATERQMASKKNDGHTGKKILLCEIQCNVCGSGWRGGGGGRGLLI